MHNINVALRVRPLNDKEIENGEDRIWNILCVAEVGK